MKEKWEILDQAAVKMRVRNIQLLRGRSRCVPCREAPLQFLCAPSSA
jgi:hypothetical protein